MCVLAVRTTRARALQLGEAGTANGVRFSGMVFETCHHTTLPTSGFETVETRRLHSQCLLPEHAELGLEELIFVTPDTLSKEAHPDNGEGNHPKSPAEANASHEPSCHRRPVAQDRVGYCRPTWPRSCRDIKFGPQRPW